MTIPKPGPTPNTCQTLLASGGRTCGEKVPHYDLSFSVSRRVVAVEAETPDEPDFARSAADLFQKSALSLPVVPDATEDERKLTHCEEAVRLRKGMQAIDPEKLEDSLLWHITASRTKKDPVASGPVKSQ